MEIKKTLWVIMDKKRGLIAKGVPRSRCLCFVDGIDRKRILTYSSKAMAENGFKLSGFFTHWYQKNSIEDYVKKNYKISHIKWEQYLEAVEAEFIIRTK